MASQSINVIECPEFRALLLLLRGELKDSDIPHRIKLHGQVMKAWVQWFMELKKELGVSSKQLYSSQQF